MDQQKAKRIFAVGLHSTDPELFKTVEACRNDEDRFTFAEAYIQGIFFLHSASFDSWSPAIRFHGKNLGETKELVSVGLAHVAAKRYETALETFNKGVRVAPWRTKETPEEEVEFCVAGVLGHRATALFRIDRFVECIMDVDQAFSLECPREMKPKLLLMKAEAFLLMNRPACAVSVLEDEAVLLRLFREPDDDKMQYDALLDRCRKESAKASKRRRLLPEPFKPLHPTSTEILAELKKLELKHGRSKKFPCASAGVKLEYSEEFGRQLVARKDFNIGDVVLVEPSYVSYLKTTSVLTTYCYACCMYTETPFPCRKCSSVVFCSPVCAAGPKASLHSKECSFWMTFIIHEGGGKEEDPGPSNMNSNVIMAVRVLLSRTPQEWKAFFASSQDRNIATESPIPRSVYHTDDYENVFRLAKNTNPKYSGLVFEAACDMHFLESLLETVCSVVFAMKILNEVYLGVDDVLDKNFRRELGGLLIHHAIAFASNWDSLRELNMKGTGKFSLGIAAAVIHPTASLINYSCSPNLFEWHYGDTLVLKAARPLKKGDVLHVNRIGRYVEMPFEMRQAYAGVMGYRCKCTPCLEKWPTLETIIQRFNDGFLEVVCMYCSAIFEIVSSMGAGQRCPRCNKNISEWHKAFKLLHAKLFYKGKVFGDWCGPKEVKPLLPYIVKTYRLCGDGSYPVAHVDSMVKKWMVAQSREITHPGFKLVESGRR